MPSEYGKTKPCESLSRIRQTLQFGARHTGCPGLHTLWDRDFLLVQHPGPITEQVPLQQDTWVRTALGQQHSEPCESALAP